MKNTIKNLLAKTFIFAISISSIFAQSSNSSTSTATALGNLKKVFGTVYTFFTSTYTLVICTIGLIWVGIKWITNRGEPTILKDLGPKVAAFLLIGGASGFCQLFFTPSKNIDAITNNTAVFDGLF